MSLSPQEPPPAGPADLQAALQAVRALVAQGQPMQALRVKAHTARTVPCRVAAAALAAAATQPTAATPPLPQVLADVMRTAGLEREAGESVLR